MTRVSDAGASSPWRISRVRGSHVFSGTRDSPPKDRERERQTVTASGRAAGGQEGGRQGERTGRRELDRERESAPTRRRKAHAPSYARQRDLADESSRDVVSRPSTLAPVVAPLCIAVIRRLVYYYPRLCRATDRGRGNMAYLRFTDACVHDRHGEAFHDVAVPLAWGRGFLRRAASLRSVLLFSSTLVVSRVFLYGCLMYRTSCLLYRRRRRLGTFRFRPKNASRRVHLRNSSRRDAARVGATESRQVSPAARAVSIFNVLRGGNFDTIVLGMWNEWRRADLPDEPAVNVPRINLELAR